MSGMLWRVGLLALCVVAAFPALALAGETIDVCYNYGCLTQAAVSFSDAQLSLVAAHLRLAENAEDERLLLALVMGKLYGWAGQQTPIHNDRGGNAADEGRPGSMDCIDHSTTSVRLLGMLEKRGLLRFHRVVGRVQRMRFLVVEHWGAEIAQKAESGEPGDEAVRHFVVDTWFRDNGKPAVVLPLKDWMSGEGPN